MLNGTLYPFQQEGLDQMVTRGTQLLAMTMGAGKALADDTPVLTANGWREMASLRVGDEVIGANGYPTSVTGVFPQGRRPSYVVHFSDGASIVCDEDHLWHVQSAEQRYRRCGFSILTTKEMFSAGTHSPRGNSKWFIPLVDPVQLPPAELPIPPYTMGVILGDGSIRPSGNVQITTDEGCVAGVPGHAGHHSSPGIVTFTAHGLGERMRSLGLAGHRSWEKFVPNEYLWSSAEQRRDLLAGLLDTDGSPDGRGGVEFSTTSRPLMDAVIHLARSLGGVCGGVSERTTTYTYLGEKRVGRPSWRTLVKMPFNPHRLERKRRVWDGSPGKYPPRRSIASIEEIGLRSTTCISVAAQDGLFVANDFVVTHNTVTAIAACEHLFGEGEIESVLVIVPSSLKFQWQEAIHKFTDRHALVIDGPPKVREILYSAAARYYYVVTGYETLVNDFDVYADGPYDAVIIDEASFIKSFNTNRSKAVKKLRKKAKTRFALTGQPVENRPEDLYSIMQFVDPQVLGNFRDFDRTFIRRDYWGKPKHYVNLKVLHNRMQGVMFRRSREDIKDQLPRVVEKTSYSTFSKRERDLYNFIKDDILDKMEASMAAFGEKFDLSANYGLTGGNNKAMMKAQGELMSMMLCLRMACIDPAMIAESAERFSPNEEGKSDGGSKYAAMFMQQNPGYSFPPSTKMADLVKLVEQLLDESPQTKVVIFSFFKGALRSAESALDKVLNPYCRAVHFNGDMTARAKERSKRDFQTNAETRIFLSSDAGGYGVDLPQANYLISLDLPWSTGKFEQRESRIIRLSSEFEHVTLIQMLVHGSIEQRIHDMLDQKKGVADAWVDGKHDAKGRFDLTLSTLTKFLQESAV